MTTINNDNFTIKEKNMTTEEVEKEAEATLDVEGVTLEHAEKLHDINNDIKNLQRVTVAQKELISSANEKNDALQNKLNIIDDNVKIVIPRATLEDAIEKAIMKVNTQLSDSVNEVNYAINSLYEEDVQEALKDVCKFNDISNKLDKIADVVDELPDVDDLQYRLEDVEYKVEDVDDKSITECVVNDLIASYLSDEGYALSDDVSNDILTLDKDMKILGQAINELRSKTLSKRISRLFKNMFSYNLANKVRAIFKRTNNKDIQPTYIKKAPRPKAPKKN